VSGRVALVTGANRGIGTAIAQLLVELGYDVLAGSRDLAKGEATAAAIGARAVELDITDQASVDAAFAELDRLDVLVNNAAIHYDTWESASTADLATVQEALQTNLVGAWRCALAAVPLMRAARYGRIVNVSSGSGSITEPSAIAPAYAVSKAALNMLTRSLALDLCGSGILVNAACPGWVRTDMGGPAASRSPREGADTPVWLATLPDDGPTGGFFRDRAPAAW
jgi:NAD(P)-dependent dehydrogenase (short-subunit alcohol dehydrogenase family)